WLLASAALHPPLYALSMAIVGVRFFGIARAVCRYFERYFSHTMAFEGLYGLRVWFYQKLEPISLRVFKALGAGDMLGRIMADIETLQFFYLRVLIPPAAACILSLLVGFFIGQVTPLLWIVVAISFIMSVLVIPLLVVGHNHRISQLVSQAQGEAKVDLTETLVGMEDIIAYGQADSVCQRLEKRFEVIDNHKSAISRGTNGGNVAFLALIQVAGIAAALLAGYAVDGVEASVWVAVVAIIVQAWFEALQPMTVAVHHGYESALAVRRLGAIEEAPQAVQEPAVPGPIPSRYDIVFDKMRFAYDGPMIYQNFDLTIPEQERVAIVGASGAGKSTLFNALTRLYDYEGSIRIGGQELKAMTSEDGRS
ncbi:MAG: ATP-binding cassette domain-containing protein, partial [Veillonella sp.]|nr:ATP-binding cassette domain-containing protein [Veillonella sp.]